MEIPTITQISQRVGKGFITGHAFASAGAIVHTVFSAPKGSKISEFSVQFSQRARDNGVSMATWAIVNSVATDPLVNKYIKDPYLRELASGALTGGIMEWRNGVKGVMSGAFQGVLQSLFMNSVGAVIRTTVGPITTYIHKQKAKKFREERNAETLKPPLEAIMSVLIPTKE